MQRLAVSPLPRFALLAVFVVACDGSTEPPVPTTIRLEPAAVELEWGGSAEVTAEILDQHGRRIEDWPQGFDLDWAIDDASIAVLDEGIRTSSIRSRLMNGGGIILTVTAAGIPPAQAAITALSAPDTIAGELGFRYEGNRAGTFAVEGEWPFDHEAPQIVYSPEYLRGQGAWTVSYHNPAANYQTITARHLRTDGWEDRFAIQISGRIVQPGTYDVTAVSLYLGWRMDPHLGDISSARYTQGSGSVTITSAGPDHVAGTFHLTLIDRSEDPWVEVETEEGQFQAPLLMDRPWP